MRASKLRLMAEHGADIAADLEAKAEVQQKFLAVLGRPPYPGEILQMAHDWTRAQVDSNEYFVENLPHFQRKFRDMLAQYHLQVIEAAPTLPGFVIGDVPVVHALLASQRFGFRDRLAIGDADYVAGPISRRVAVLFTVNRLPHKVIQTKKLIA